MPYTIFTRTQIISFLGSISILFIILSILFLGFNSKLFIRRYVIYIISIIILLIFSTSLVWYFNQIAITIVEPRNGDFVTSNIDVKGLAKNIPAGETIWLMVVSPTGKYYPHSPAIMPDIQTGLWQLKGVTLGTPVDNGKSFYLITTTADTNSKSDLDNYFKKVALADGWMGLDTLPPGIKVYDKVKITRSK
jgi:hypothetical protein